MITKLALCGGGFFGYAEVGVLKQLEQSDRVNIDDIRGTSVGSIIAALMAVGYTSDEMKDILFTLKIDELIQDSRIPYVNLYMEYGEYHAHALYQAIENLIHARTGKENCTFSDIKIDLHIIATNLNLQRQVIFNRKSHPELPISLAVRASFAYPGVITPIKIGEDMYNDGGLCINYPIMTFEDHELDNVIGITFAAQGENDACQLTKRVEITDHKEYIKANIGAIMRSTYSSQIKKKHLNRSIIVKITSNISSMQFGMSEEIKKSIYNDGIKSADENNKLFM
jgi:NTE family protein